MKNIQVDHADQAVQAASEAEEASTCSTASAVASAASTAGVPLEVVFSFRATILFSASILYTEASTSGPKNLL